MTNLLAGITIGVYAIITIATEYQVLGLMGMVIGVVTLIWTGKITIRE